MINKLATAFYSVLDKVYLKSDRARVRRTRNIQMIPGAFWRRGGKVSYAEWAHVIGIFQTLLYQSLDKKQGNSILDVGCGTGLLGIAAMPLVTDGGKYTGIDVIKKDIAYCRSVFPSASSEFIHFDLANATYSSAQSKELKPWPIASSSQDAVTALSVWTHLNERDAIFYLKEVERVLKPGARAIISFFRLDSLYDQSLTIRTDSKGRFHTTSQRKWIFSEKAHESDCWMTPEWVRNPEDAIAVNEEGIKRLTGESGLVIDQYYPGNWKEQPGVYFQDILIFQKTS
jgi:SAM-dependent methyltransferase